MSIHGNAPTKVQDDFDSSLHTIAAHTVAREASPSLISAGDVDSDSDTDNSTVYGDDGADNKPSKRQRFRALRAQAKAVPKRILARAEIFTGPNPDMDADGEVIEGITDNPAFNTGELFEKKHNAVSATAIKAASLLSDAAQIVAHPRHHTKRKTAGMLTASEHPYLSERADEELLEAHEDLKYLNSGDGQDVAERRRRVDDLRQKRDTMRTAWVTGKHVKRARVVVESRVDFPDSKEYYELDDVGRRGRWQWERYAGHLLLYLSQDFTPQYIEDSNDVAFRRSTLINNAERFLMATAPWQLWAMHIRKVYRWEDKILTLKWLASFLFMMKSGYIVTLSYLWIIYITVKNKVMGDDMRFLRESHERATHKDNQVYTISELVMQHGGSDWVDPLLEELGPLIQQQLGDLADFLEILTNFYMWSEPRATLITLIFWFTCALVAGLGSTEHGMKIFIWVVGLYFFASRPIASYYPKYRKAVSLFRWIVWEIPTNAELAFRDLRTDAEKVSEKVLRERADKARHADSVTRATPSTRSTTVAFANGTHPAADPNTRRRGDSGASLSTSSTSDDSDDDDDDTSLTGIDILSFRGKWNKNLGRLIITTTGIRFVRSYNSKRSLLHSNIDPHTTDNELWHRPYSDILELRKVEAADEDLAQRRPVGETDTLVISWKNGGKDSCIEGMRKMNEAFNCVLGFSGLRFMNLQPTIGGEDEEGDGKGSGKKLKGGKEGTVFDEVFKV